MTLLPALGTRKPHLSGFRIPPLARSQQALDAPLTLTALASGYAHAASLGREVALPLDEVEAVVGTWRDQSDPPMWVQPAGSVGLWQVDDTATHQSKTWRCTSANNSFAPGAFGWVEV